MTKQSKSFLALFLAAALSLVGLTSARAEDKPSVIRIVYPGVGVGNRPYGGGNTAAVVHLQGLFEEEFKKDGIQVNWTFVRGAGPAVNELYANGLVDFSVLGDLPSIVGHSGGLKTKVLAATATRGNTYLIVPADSPIQSIKDLKGKRVAIFKGTNLQLAVAKILEANGLSEKDVRFLNMDSGTSRAALITKDIDALFSGNDLLSLRDQGAGKIVYRTDGDPRFLRHSSFVGSENFIKKYPQITQRVVKTLVRAAKWVSDQEKNPGPVYQLWAKSGTRFQDFKEDLRAQSLKVLSSPLLDDYLTAQYKSQITNAKRFGLLKNTFAVESWFEPRFLAQALKELGLENYWDRVDVNGYVAKSQGESAQLAPTANAAP